MAIYERKFTIGVTDINIDATISNKAILRIFEDIAGMHSEMVGLGINDIKNTKLSWVILNWKIKIIKRPKYNDTINVNTWIRNANRAVLYRDFEIYDENNNIMAVGTSKWTLINIDSKSIARIPNEAIKKYGEEDNSVFEDNEIKKIKEPELYNKEVEYLALRRDIDINNHMHNLYYLDLAYEVLPYEIYNKSEFNNIEILYKKQIKYKDEVCCLYTRQGEKYIITMKSRNREITYAIIELY